MNIDIICVGKVKENFYRDAIDEYLKRLSKYVNMHIYEVKDEKTPDKCSDHESDLIMQKEAEKIQKYLVADSYKYFLCIEGKELDSISFSNDISAKELSGHSHLQFVIGGSLGIYKSLKEKADMKISFSKMTFPHQLMRVILLEQIYRAYRIKTGEPYHK